MYTFELINEYTLKIIDEYDESIFLIEGADQVLCIDSGMSKENLYEYCLNFTDKPILLALSHGHIDHIGQSGSFENVFMNQKDQAVYWAHTQMPDRGHFSTKGLNFKDIEEIQEMPQVFHLGQRDIYVFPLEGHTPGSVIFIDPSDKHIYTGDAIGSGCGCWMQLDESSNITNYKKALWNILKVFKAFQVDETWKFFGGHDKQEFQSKVSSYNPLDLKLVKDMHKLCVELGKGTIDFQETENMAMSQKPYYVVYNKAEMITTKEKASK
ncbi:MAG: MBL fold metallo-hydrolase [Bacillota bacterium]|nr:MBL fold metallo-hydrolase [Bacillota bacterium]